MTGSSLLEVTDLVTRFDIKAGLFGKVVGRVHAVENVSFGVAPGETIAIVGESGCGKSTVARSVMQLETPRSGSIRFAGEEIIRGSRRKLQDFRRNVQMVFQDPFASLNPRMTVLRTLTDPMRVHRSVPSGEMRRRAVELLAQVELDPSALDRFPHAFSGGQRQRICIARALALEPTLIIADEAVASLDVTIQAQVINLLMDLQTQFGIALIFISHDMAVVERIAHRVAVMYLGEIVEIGDRQSVFNDPQHSYTKKLLSMVPIADPHDRRENRQLMSDEVPSALRAPDFRPVHLPMIEVSGTHLVRAEGGADTRHI